MNSWKLVRLFSVENGRFYFFAALVSIFSFVMIPHSASSRTWYIKADGTGDLSIIGITHYAGKNDALSGESNPSFHSACNGMSYIKRNCEDNLGFGVWYTFE